MKCDLLNRWNRLLLERIVRQENRSSLRQDLDEELIERTRSAGSVKAGVWLTRQVMRSAWELLALRMVGQGRLLASEIKVALRVVKRQRTFTLINVLGLSLGLACAMIIMLFVYHEQSFDQFHRQKDRIYRLTYERERQGKTMSLASASMAHASLLQDALPELESLVFLRQHYQVSTSVGQRKFSVDPLYATENFFQVFTFSLLQGDEKTALSAPYSVVITPELARKYFDDKDPIGRTIEIERGRTLTVTGLLKPLPQNSHIQADFIASFQGLEETYKTLINVYLLFDQSIESSVIEAKIAEILKPHFRSEKDYYTLLPLTAIHFSKKLGLDIARKGSAQVSWVLVALALAILSTSCINYANLGLAKSLSRLKEVGLRKVVGAGRGQITRQFLLEGLLHTLAAALIAFGLMVLALPYVETWSHFQFAAHLGMSPSLYGLYLGMVLLTGLASGMYPSLAASRFVPIVLLKGQGGGQSRTGTFRKGLMVMQFTVSCMLMAVSLVVMTQLRFLMHKDLGVDGQSVVEISYFKDEAINKNPEQFKAALQDVAGVEAVSICTSSPGFDSNVIYGVHLTSNPDASLDIPVFDIDEDYFRVFRVPLILGRQFSPEYTGDRENAVILNQSAVEAFGLADPIGAKLHLDLYEKDVTVIGVIQDFHMETLRRPIRPLIFYNNGWLWSQAMVRLHPQAGLQTLKEIRKVWEAMATEEPFESTLFEDKVQRSYRAERSLFQIVQYAAVFSAFIAGLGLFGMSAFWVHQRIKEVGIRKILGASFWNVGLLLCRPFSMLMLVANGLAWPLVYVLMSGWLQRFAYRTAFPLWAPPVVLGIMLLVMLFIVGIHVAGAVRMNPIHTLRQE